ncbi:hypothetical protein HHI36_013640 [Cryptolaemus montrouzieri]|uniref:Uncharacterized protein n=1 Tax=Cryptolaemus montrouzieri TaxID=559131 RepID=A0ABD2NIU7_9CUCU
MFFKSVLFSVFLCSLNAENICFENVTVHGYSVFNHKFDKVITSSKISKTELPNVAFDAIELKNENVPILYENCISDIESLDELILEKNGIQEIRAGALRNLPAIRIIKLGQNKLKTIVTGVFNNLQVSDVDLSKNEIEVIEDTAFNDMPELLSIKLTDNKLTKWNKNWFLNTPLLNRLSFQHNLIEELPAEAFTNLKGKKKFGRLSLDVNLIFSYNKIKTLHPDTFKDIKDINNLWLDNNLIEEIPENIFTDVSIRQLRISSNKLTCIKEKDSLLKAEMNEIDANPFDCECLEDIKTWAKGKNKTIDTFYASMNCYSNKMDRKMKNLEDMLKKMKEEEKLFQQALKVYKQK